MYVTVSKATLSDEALRLCRRQTRRTIVFSDGDILLKFIDVPVPVFISQESPVCADAACEMETADVGTVWCL